MLKDPLAIHKSTVATNIMTLKYVTDKYFHFISCTLNFSSCFMTRRISCCSFKSQQNVNNFLTFGVTS